MASLLDKGKQKTLPPVSVHFLGTCSGGGPITSRNCSSLAVDFGNDVWLFDAADGTLSRLHQSSLKMSNISRIFITHLHADHVLGVVAIMTQASLNIYGPPGSRHLLRTTLRLCSATLAGAYAVHELLDAEDSASVGCADDEMLLNEAVGRDVLCGEDGVWRDVVHEGEGPGRRGWGVSSGPLKHRVASHGYVLTEPAPRLPLDTSTLIPLLTSHAAALRSRDPPISHPLSILSHLTSLPPPPPFILPDGTTLHPPGPSGVSGRKIVIFGDCSGGTPNPAFAALCADASLLVHECTNAAIPERFQRGEKGRKVRVEGLEHSLLKKREIQQGGKLGEEEGGQYEGANGHGMNGDSGGECEVEVSPEEKERDEKKRLEVRKKAESRGHSTPREVGEFARSIRARRVVVNHFSAMFPAPRYPSSSPLPSLLSPISPYPYPTPHPIPHCPYPSIDPFPLTPAELHARVILQSITDQVDEVWHAEAETPPVPPGRCVAARDFMVYRLPGHELGEGEVAESAETERVEVMRSWAKYGGVWIQESNGRRWVGVQTPPSSA